MLRSARAVTVFIFDGLIGMLLSEAGERRLLQLLASIANSFSVFMIGRELGQTVIQASRNAFMNVSSVPTTFLEQSYVAGKVARIAGTNALKSMTETELQDFILNTNLQLTEADQVKLSTLRRDTSRWMEGRSEAWGQKIKASVFNADREWRAELSTGSFFDRGTRSTARNAALRNLMDRIRDDQAGMQTDVDRLVQSEMHHYFQEGQVADVPGDEIVYKVPRFNACPHCMRVHLGPDGTPKKYRLQDVQGNSNVGLPARAWKFTIGPLHPYCYCVLFREIDRPVPDESTRGSQRLKAERRERLAKAAEGLFVPNSCGLVDMDTLFEEQLLKSGDGHDHEVPRHVKVLITAVKRVYGER